MNEKKLNTEGERGWESERERERGEERPKSNNEWPADFTKASDKSKTSRLMAIEGKQIQVNLWLDNKKKPLHSDFPWGSQTHGQTVNILKKGT